MVLTMSGKPYNLGVTTSTGVVRGLVTGVGNTTIRLVMTDSSTIDIDKYPEYFASDADINTRITSSIFCKN